MATTSRKQRQFQPFSTLPLLWMRIDQSFPRLEGASNILGKSKPKKINLTLFIHPSWIKGAKGVDGVGKLGGSVTDDAASTSRWLKLRAESLAYIEVRGAVPEVIV